MEKNNNWLVKAVVKSLVFGLIFFALVYFFYGGETSRVELSSNAMINSIGFGVIAVIIAFIESVITRVLRERKKSYK